MSDVVGFVGTGVMGRPMARNLLAAGVDLVVYSRRPEVREELVSAGAVAAETIAEVAAVSDIVITMVSDDRAVRDVVIDQLVAALRPGTLLVDMSTISPAVSREVARAAEAVGCTALDAPVSGGDIGARERTLAIMVGGDAGDLDRAKPLLEILGSRIVHVGPHGTGQAVKACNQVLVAITIAGVSEALVLGESLGIEPSLILDVLGAGLAANRVMEVRRNHFLAHEFTPGFTIDLHHKDLQIALGAAGKANVPLPITAATQQLVRQARAMGLGGSDHTAILAALESQAQRPATGQRPARPGLDEGPVMP